jgi:hypothetical protein
MSVDDLLTLLLIQQRRADFWKRQLELAPSERVCDSPKRYIEHYEREVAKLEREIAAINRKAASPIDDSLSPHE